MLTIFGKKKKEDDTSQPTDPKNIASTTQSAQASASPPSQTANPAPPTSQQSPPATKQPQSQPQSQPIQQQPAIRPTSAQPIFRSSPMAPLPAEETSLTKLLQSLLSDIPLPPDSDSSFGQAQSTPDYVPLRSTPPSRPMVIGPGKEVGEWDEPEQPAAKQPSPVTPSGKTKVQEVQPPPAKVPPPTPSQPMALKKDQQPEKTVEKPKVDKQPEKPTAPKKSPQGFEHIFQLTEGNLENAGLVIINGEAGSGRTTFCSGLTNNYMKTGNACLYLTCDQSPSALRDQMKKLGTDAAQYESGFRLIVVDGFASQSESFSMEMYYVDQPFNVETVTDAITRSSGMFVGEKVRVIFDSIDKLVAKTPGKEFTKGITDLMTKLRDSGSTFILTVDMSKVSKDTAGPLNDLADCVIDLSKDESDPNGREVKVQRLNHSPAKVDAETFEIDPNKGLVFV